MIYWRRMKRVVRGMIERGFGMLPLILLQRMTGNTAFFPYYHLVSAEAPSFVGKSYPVVTPREFERQLDGLLKHFCPVELLTLVKAAKNNLPIPQKSFHLTFDDGYREIYEVVFPILRRKGIPATFFICSDLLDNKNVFWENLFHLVNGSWFKLPDSTKGAIAKDFPDLVTVISEPPAFRNRQKYGLLIEVLQFSPESFLQKEQPYLTSPQIREMMASGFTIGSHSIDHPVFKDLTLSEQLCQIEESCRVMAEAFQLDYRVFAFPYGEFGVGRALFETLQERGTTDLLFGTRGIIPDEYPWVIQRFGMEQAHAWKAIRTELAMKWIRRRVKNDLVIRRQ